MPLPRTLTGHRDPTPVAEQAHVPGGQPGPAPRPPAALIWTLVALALVTGYRWLPGLAAELLFQLTAWTAIALLVRGAWRRGAARPAWLAVAAGWACFALGDLLFALHEHVLHVSAFPSPADLAYLAGYPLLVAGLAGLLRGRRPGGDRVALLDAAIVAVSFAVLGWVYVVAPAAGGGAVLARLVSGAYPVGDLLCLAVLVRMLLDPGSRLRQAPRALWLLGGTVAAMLLADVGFLLAEQTGVYVPRGWIDATYLLTYLGVAAVGLDPTVASVAEPAPAAPAELTRRRLLLLLAAALLIPMVLAVETIRGRSLPVLVIVLGTVATVALVVARMAGLVVELARSRDALAHEAAHDVLTGVANRTLFARRLAADLARGRRCGVMVIDLDGFKDVNDELGHLTGDALLVETAQRLALAVRPTDVVARLSGDEFAVLLRDADERATRSAAERVEELLNSDVVVMGQRARLRASVGVARWDPSEAAPGLQSVDSLLAAADRAMYATKRRRPGHRRSPRHLAPVPSEPGADAPAPLIALVPA